MKFTDVTTLTQKAIAQTLGDEYMAQLGTLAELESYKLVDVGKDVLDGGTVDSYVKALLTVMGKMVVDAKRYTAEIPSIFVDNFEWGGFVERVYFAPQDVISDEMYNLVDGRDYGEFEHKFYKPRASAKIFEEAKAIVTPISITRDQIKMAFTSWDEMNRFLSGVYTNVENTITLAMEAYAHMLISCGIAVSNSATETAVHLLTEAKAAGIVEDAATADDAMKSPEFLTFAMFRIAETRDHMKRYTTAFSNGTIPSFTDDNDNKLAVLSDFSRRCRFYVKADTYHEEMKSIGKYDTVSAWQAFKVDEKPDFALETASTVSIAADADNKLGVGTDAVTIPYVIAVAYDHRAMGLCPHRTKVTTNYTASADFWNEWHHQLVNYILDANYKIVAFVVD